MHTAAPTAAENLQSGQLRQTFTDVAHGTAEYLPASHRVQLDLPAVPKGVNVSASHCKQRVIEH